uniref:Uncharacterized protein LOC116953654 isoform X1 n=1 Tax=Petromyzon marinus TaxID=7757 RepID=A0AAJ7XCR9_PETMA|nr:uncharacterized protein LOC116953654 isoform X1 [Petromyzon marinus]
MALHLSPAPSPDHRPHHHHHHHHHPPPPPPLLLLLLAASAVALSSGRAEAQEAGGHPSCPLGEETPAEGVRYPACRCGVEFARPLPEEILPADPASRREQGYHRDEVGGWYYCRRCRDCALGGRVMLAGCSRARDAVCGGCARPGARYDARVLACVPDGEHERRGNEPAASSTRVDNITEQVIEGEPARRGGGGGIPRVPSSRLARVAAAAAARSPRSSHHRSPSRAPSPRSESEVLILRLERASDR